MGVNESSLSERNNDINDNVAPKVSSFESIKKLVLVCANKAFRTYVIEISSWLQT